MRPQQITGDALQHPIVHPGGALQQIGWPMRIIVHLLAHLDGLVAVAERRRQVHHLAQVPELVAEVQHATRAIQIHLDGVLEGCFQFQRGRQVVYNRDALAELLATGRRQAEFCGGGSNGLGWIRSYGGLATVRTVEGDVAGYCDYFLQHMRTLIANALK